MKILNAILLIFCLSFGSLNAQNDPEAEEILQEISTKYEAYKTSHINLKLIIDVPESDESIVQEGEAWLKGDKFKIEFEERMLVSNNVTQWTYLKEVNEVQISDYDPNSLVFLPSKIFDLYNDDYIYRVKESYKNGKGELIKDIELSPINKEVEIFKIVVSINTVSNTIEKTKIFEKSGIKYSYEILSLETNIDLADSFFTFDMKEHKIEEDDITDLR